MSNNTKSDSIAIIISIISLIGVIITAYFSYKTDKNQNQTALQVERMQEEHNQKELLTQEKFKQLNTEDDKRLDIMEKWFTLTAEIDLIKRVIIIRDDAKHWNRQDQVDYLNSTYFDKALETIKNYQISLNNIKAHFPKCRSKVTILLYSYNPKDVSFWANINNDNIQNLTDCLIQNGD